MRFLSNNDVAKILDMNVCLEALRAGYNDLVRGDAAYIPRIDMWAPTGQSDQYYRWGSMSGVCRTYGVAATRNPMYYPGPVVKLWKNTVWSLEPIVGLSCCTVHKMASLWPFCRTVTCSTCGWVVVPD